VPRRLRGHRLPWYHEFPPSAHRFAGLAVAAHANDPPGLPQLAGIAAASSASSRNMSIGRGRTAGQGPVALATTTDAAGVEVSPSIADGKRVPAVDNAADAVAGDACGMFVSSVCYTSKPLFLRRFHTRCSWCCRRRLRGRLGSLERRLGNLSRRRRNFSGCRRSLSRRRRNLTGRLSRRLLGRGSENQCGCEGEGEDCAHRSYSEGRP
jgi:hypothetical protein